jgi:hypothetical protein
MGCINATKRTRFSSLFVAIVKAVTAAAAIEEAYFWSTTHAEASRSPMSIQVERERERDRPSEEKMKNKKNKKEERRRKEGTAVAEK